MRSLIFLLFFILIANVHALTIVDDFGYVTVINETPKRIVSLAPSNTEILFALGVGDRVVGVTDYCNYPPEVVELRKSGLIESVGGYSTVNIEKVIALNPDVVFAAYGNGREVVEVLRGFGIKVIALNPRNIDDVMRCIETIGRVIGEEENATKLINWMKSEVEKIKEKTKNYKKKPKIAHIIWNDPIWVSGNKTFADDVIELAGGINAFDDLDGWKIVSYEELISKDPDIIIVNSGSGMGGGRNILYEWALKELSDLRAVKEGRVYVIDSDIIDRPSYRLVYALENISKWVEEWESGQLSEEKIEKKAPGFEIVLALACLYIARKI